MLIAFRPFEWIIDLVSGQPWTYALVTGIALVEAVVPMIPAETVLLTAAIFATEGELSIFLVGVAGLVGSVAGDNLSYAIGRCFGRTAYFAVTGGEAARRRYEWAADVLCRHGGWILPAARFVPAGRTAITLAAGTVRVEWRDFFVWDLLAGAIWAAVYTALGYLGGATFTEKKWAGFALAFGIAMLIALIGFTYYRIQRDD